MKLLNKTSYSKLTLAQEYTICFKIIEEPKIKENKYGNSIQVWIKPSRKFEPTTGTYKTRIHKKISKSGLDGVKRDLEHWITNL